MKKLPVIAAFDFDNTITTRDSLVPFLFYVHGKWKTLLKLTLLLPYLIGFVLKIVTRQQVKEKILASFFAGESYENLLVIGKKYADFHLDRWVKPNALEKICWHQNQGHRCVLLSASIDPYLLEWAKRKGIDEVICSRLEIDEQGKVTGKLQGKNCWGEEKKSQFIKRFGSKESYELYMYGDSAGDYPMLEWADHPVYRGI